jgi:hypothetical protein
MLYLKDTKQKMRVIHLMDKLGDLVADLFVLFIYGVYFGIPLVVLILIILGR